MFNNQLKHKIKELKQKEKNQKNKIAELESKFDENELQKKNENLTQTLELMKVIAILNSNEKKKIFSGPIN